VCRFAALLATMLLAMPGGPLAAATAPPPECFNLPDTRELNRATTDTVRLREVVAP
jgi:hypothetical protein